MQVQIPQGNPAETEGVYAAMSLVRLRDVWDVLLRRRRLMIANLVAVLVASAIFSFSRTPLYRATAVIQVSPGGRIHLVDDATIEESRTRYDEFFATQQSILKSRRLARRVMDELEPWEHPVFQEGEQEQASGSAEVRARQTEKLLEMLVVSPIGDTELIQISYTSPDPELSARLTNTLASQYLAYSAESISGVARGTSSFIQGQIEKLQKEITDKEKLLQEYSQRENLVMLDKHEDIEVQRLQEFNKELTEVQAELAEASARYRSLQNADANSFLEILNNGTIEDLKREQGELQQRLTELSAKFKDSYPEVQQTTSALEEIENRLAQATSDVASGVIAAARVRYETAVRREAILQQAMEKQRQQTRDLNTVASDYRRIKVELDNQRRILEQLLRQHSATGLSAELGEKQPSMAVRILDEAVVPTKRYSPKHGANLSIGAFVGAVLAIGVAFLMHYRDGTLYTVEDIRRYVDLPLLGSVAHVPLRKNGVKAPVGFTEHAKFLALLFFGHNQRAKSILVTSSTEAEGKTFVACQLAACLTQLGSRVLLVDANLRAPKLQDIFEVPGRSGLSSVLAGTGEVCHDCVRSTLVPNLYVIPSGPTCAAPAELFGSASLERFLRESSEQFDYIVLDSAPLQKVIDSHVLLRQCDAAVLVTRSGFSTRQSIQTTRELIASEHAKITGVVLNDVENQRMVKGYPSGGLDQRPRPGRPPALPPRTARRS